MAKARARAKAKTTRKTTRKTTKKAAGRAKGKVITARGKTSTGLEPNLAGLLCYVLGWVTGLVFFIMEPKNKFVRFHAVQSIIVFGAFNVVFIILWLLTWVPYIWILFLVLSYIVGVFAFILWIVLMLKAYGGQKFKLPVAGDIAEKQA
jgi:uncharacterized membrane protein